MSLCINPNCRQPQNTDAQHFCQSCGSELLLMRRYRVVKLLGGGGFANTYEVIHNNTAKVLKILIISETKAVSLFQQEADVIIDKLNHPGIPKGEEYFVFHPRNSQNPLYCLVMQYIKGLDLEKYQEQRQNAPIDQKSALEWLIQLANILHEVHQQNFFHRDIKPSNIILQPDGQLALIDFGAARQVTPTIMAGNRNTQIYTPGYAPPEQEKGYAVPQSDFFALGRTFVYLLTGKHPLDTTIYDPNTDELRWRNLANNVSPLLADFIDQLMGRLVSQRPANTKVILQRLEQIERSLYPSQKPGFSKKPGFLSNSVTSTGSSHSSNSTQQQATRRQFIQLASIAGGSLVAGLFIRELFKGNSPSSTPLVSPGETPPKEIARLSLQSFDFNVVTVNAQGQETTRQRQQANFFSEYLGNGITLEMVSIPGGTFTMGSPSSEKDRYSNESPQHSVTVKPFFMGKFTVTQKQWQTIMQTNPSRFKGNDNLPVENISWNDAVEFCTRLSKKTGRSYRLPSEAEWEYACRADTTTPFHFGETITSELANYDGNYTYGSGPKGTYRHQTTPVGSFQVANAFGLYDMHGNILEWCADTYYNNYQGAPSDGSVWESGRDNTYRLLCGGCWHYYSRRCRSASRDWGTADARSGYFGFRVSVTS